MPCQLLFILLAGFIGVAIATDRALDERQARPAPGQLNNFQVSEPVLTPQGKSDQYGCIHTTVLMEYNFANSYGKPFVGPYTPPPCDFNRVTMNLTVTSQGRQFDRIAIMYLGDIEVFRTSTAEPTKNGIIWNYVKEMQMYNSLWTKPQTIIYDEGNIVDDTYTGIFNTTLTATFFTVPDSSASADLILPITSRQGSCGKGSVFSLPDQNATIAYTFPQNINRAVVSLSATGQIGEEFWYSNVPSSRAGTFANTTGQLQGGGTFREVQLYIDEHLCGVSWPFPVIFTGGVVPGLWRPIAGIETFDLLQHEIDITPWLGYLLDGKSHSFSIRVASVDDDGNSQASLSGTPSYWLVTGTIFIFQDGANSVTKGALPTINTPKIDLSTTSSTTQDTKGQNDTLTYSTLARRSISISSLITTANGTFQSVWSQQLTYSNTNYLTAYGTVQLTRQTTSGHDVSGGGTSKRRTAFTKSYDYPLTVNSSYLQSQDGKSLSLQANLFRGKDLVTFGNPIFPTGLQNFNATQSSRETRFLAPNGLSSQMTLLPPDIGASLNLPSLRIAKLSTTQSGFASYFSSPNNSYSFGSTEQDFSFAGSQDTNGGGTFELYHRHVKAVNTSVVLDDQSLLGKTFGFSPSAFDASAQTAQSFAGGPQNGARAFLGRGPGKISRQSLSLQRKGKTVMILPYTKEHMPCVFLAALKNISRFQSC